MTSQATRDIKTIVGENIRTARKTARGGKGYTQKELGKLVNDVDALAVSRWERGMALPNNENFVALAEVLERTIAWFYEDHSSDPLPEVA